MGAGSNGRRLVVVEANEVPRRLVEDLAADGRIPFLAGLLADRRLIETRVTEQLERELYPSQTWASMNTGVPYDKHGVYWYGDPKPDHHPFYWQVAAGAGRSVGLINTLHSSPVALRCTDGPYRFVLPDTFSDDDQTIPAGLQRLQRANLALVDANSRRATLRARPGEVVELAKSLAHIGLRPDTLADLARLVAGVVSGRIPSERLRMGQFLILQDLCLRLARRHDPDLVVFFTNHVAAAMHRYWYAGYPEDFAERHYEQRWVDRYRNEIPAAMVALDRFLQRLHRWCRATDRTLVVASSMGQGPSGVLRTDVSNEAVVVDPERFLASIGLAAATAPSPDVADTGSDGPVRVKRAMAPQLTVDCGSVERAQEVAGRLAAAEVGEVFWDLDTAGGNGRSVVTLTARIEVVDRATVRVGGLRRDASQVGVAVYEVDDHSSGRHIPEGILAVANSPMFEAPGDKSIDQLEVAPAMLAHLGLEALPSHRIPSFRL